jgi:hypothetical protein
VRAPGCLKCVSNEREKQVSKKLKRRSERRRSKRTSRPSPGFWAKAILDDGAAALLNIQKLVLAAMALDPALCEQAAADGDWGRMFALMESLRERQPDLSWAVVGSSDDGVPITVFDDLRDAAANCDPDEEFITACKVGDGELHLRMGDEWRTISAHRVAE